MKYLVYTLVAVTNIFMFGIMYKVNGVFAADHNYNLTSEMNLLITFGEMLLLFLLGSIHVYFSKKGAAGPNAADDGSLNPDAAVSPGKKSKPSILLSIFLLICIIYTIKCLFELYTL